jgi:hypothetical protein
VVARLRALFCAHGRRQGPDVPFEVALLERRDDELAEQLIERAQAQPEFQALAPCLPARGG